MPMHTLPILPVGWRWQQHPCSFAFVVARGPDGRHSRPLLPTDRKALRDVAQSLGLQARFQPTEIARVGVTAQECEMFLQTLE